MLEESNGKLKAELDDFTLLVLNIYVKNTSVSVVNVTPVQCQLNT